MTNYELMAKLAINKSLLKERATADCPRTVYMKNGDEFQIQLFNPTTDTIGVEIKLNEKEISGGILVLRPGERIWLERYLDVAKKFKFEIYEVADNDDAVRNAIKNNGNIKVSFFKEKEQIKYIPTPINKHWWNDEIIKLTCDSTTSENCCYYQTSATINAIPTCSSATSLSNDINGCSTATLSLETGRISEGSYSKQSFKSVDNEFESYPFFTTDLKILPESRKPITASDLQKIYCTECGRKLKSKFKFCPYCGAPTFE